MFSVGDELQLRAMAAAKARGAQSGDLRKLTFDKFLVVAGDHGARGGIDSTVLADANHARATANGIMEAALAEADDGASAIAALVRRQQTLLQIDRSFKLELAFLTGMQGEACEGRLLDAAFECQPSERKETSVQQAAKELGDLLQSDLFRFYGKGAQAQITVLRVAVTDLLMNRRPRIEEDHIDNSFMFRASAALARFARHVDPSRGVLVGREAIAEQFKAAEGIVASGGTFDLGTLSFGRFHWLLDVEQKRALQKWTTMLLTSLENLSATGAVDRDPEPARPVHRRGSASAQKKPSLAEEVDDLFA